MPGKKRGRRSEASAAKSYARQAKKRKEKATEMRIDQNAGRMIHSDFDESGIVPKYGFGIWGTAHKDNFSKHAMDFYEDNFLQNRWLVVSEGPNVSNLEGKPGGGFGVFAKKSIPAGTRLCPYVGHKIWPENVRHHPKDCQYDLRVDEQLYICAKDVPYDIGYLMVCQHIEDSLDISDWARDRRWRGHDLGWHGVKRTSPCPRNFGRYINSLPRVEEPEEAVAAREAALNCTFELSDDGHDCVFIETSRLVLEGEELLLDYGPEFVI